MRVPEAPFVARVRGCLLGLAWGDALGCPIEGWRDHEIERIFGTYDRLPAEYPFAQIAAMNARRLRRLRPLGLYSDDTQQALALIQVSLGTDGWSVERWGDCLVDGMRVGAWRGYGSRFRRAVGKLANGVRPQAAGTASAGIGASMRVAVLGALCRDDPGQLTQIAMESSLTTHADVRAGALASAVAIASASLINGTSIGAIRAALPDAVRDVEEEWGCSSEDWVLERSRLHVVCESERVNVVETPELII